MAKKVSIEKIRRHALIHLPLAGMCLLAAIYLILFAYSRTAMNGSERDEFELVAKEAGEGIQKVMTDASENLRGLSAHEAFRAGAPGADDVSRIRESSDLFDEISVYDTFGSLVTSTAQELPQKVESFSTLFHAALQGNTAVSEPISVEGSSEPPKVIMMVPILDEIAQPEYVLTGTMLLDKVWERLDLPSIKNEASIALLDAYGRVLADPSDEALAQATAEVDPGEVDEAGVGKTSDENFVYLAEAVSHEKGMVGPSWTVLALRPYSAMASVMNRVNSIHVALAGATLGVMALMGMMLSRRIYEPLSSTVKAAEKVSKGQLGVQVPETGPAELRSIAAAINHMTAEVRYHRQTMSSMVEARTRSLERTQKAQERITAQLKASYDSAEEGVLVVDVVSGEILQVNRRITELFGIEEEDLKALSADNFRETLKTMFSEPVDFENRWNYYAEHPVEEGREEWQLKKPRQMNLSVYTAPVKNEGDNVVMSRLWMFRDITEQRGQEEKLRQTQQLEAMSHISGSIAHDFNNLLTVIIGNLSLAQLESGEDSEIIGYIESAQGATTEATGLVKQLLGFSNRTRLQLRDTSINKIVARVNEILRKTVNHGVKMVLDLDEELWDVPADPAQLQQVVANLSMEQVDAMPGGGELRIQTKNIDLTEEHPLRPSEMAVGEYVRVSVHKSAPGVPVGDREYLYQPLAESDANRSTLGVSMAYGIVGKHAGWISTDSKDGNGTFFAVYLPRSEKRSNVMTSEIRKDQAGGGEGTVLIVDDEPGVRRIAVTVLKRAGMATLEAADGEEALKVYQEHAADIGLVLLDLSMPKLSGRETLKAMKGIDVNLPIVLCSGYPVAPEDFEKETGHRPDGVVQKPFDVSSLASQIREIMTGCYAENVV